MTRLIKYALASFPVFQFFAATTIAQSKAHDYSGFAVIDPAYNARRLYPASGVDQSATPWIYGPAELECWRLQQLIARKDAANLKVGYTGIFHQPWQRAYFRLKLAKAVHLNSIQFLVTGAGRVSVNGTLARSFNDNAGVQECTIQDKSGVADIVIEVLSTSDLPALLVKTKEVATSNPDWEWSSGNSLWQKASHFPGKHELPPHRMEDPVVTVKPVVTSGNLYDFGRELLGYLVVRSKTMPVAGAGESAPEARDRRPEVREQSLEMLQTGVDSWRSKHPIGFRYVYLENSNSKNISADAIVRPAQYRGAFACSDSLLTRIWMNSAYTLRLCMHDFLLDGIKRDRLPWAGDLTMSSLVNAYTFGDRDIVSRSLVALSRAGIKSKDINGIVDFSLLWLIAEDQYQLYFEDRLHLQQQWPVIKESLLFLTAATDSSGFLVQRNGTRLFIDWVKQEKWTALQMLWWWAQTAGARLATRMGEDSTANTLTKNAAALKIALNRDVWSNAQQRWLPKPGADELKTRHPNFFSVVSGMASQNQWAGIKTFLQNDQIASVGSPYMGGFEVMALAQLGDVNFMLEHVKKYWGGMIKRGATSFWEAFTTKESVERQYSFYSRPYGKSLCHAWSAGPAAFLPAELLGLKPLEDGWKQFQVKPHLGSLEWVSVSTPTKHGNIIADVADGKLKISFPAGTTLRWKGELLPGPRVFEDKL